MSQLHGDQVEQEQGNRVHMK